MIPADSWIEVVEEFRVPGGIEVTRRAAPAENRYGEAVPATPSTITLDPVAVVPVAGRRRTTEATERQRETIEIYSSVALTPGSASNVADVVEFGGRRWVVSSVEDYAGIGGVYLATAELAEATT